ncbi:MAG: TusE/DsrC/DsvC family sulfur relay protein [Pseudomonadota bacterium]
MNIDEDGFLLDPEDWDKEFAKKVSQSYELELSEDHWLIIDLIRELFFETGIVPELRTILRSLKQKIGKEKATRKFIYGLYPYGYGQQACKIAGMRKPLKLWLDL